MPVSWNPYALAGANPPVEPIGREGGGRVPISGASAVERLPTRDYPGELLRALAVSVGALRRPGPALLGHRDADVHPEGSGCLVGVPEFPGIDHGPDLVDEVAERAAAVAREMLAELRDEGVGRRRP